MAMNRAQFQPGLSLPAFLKGYGSESHCEQVLEASRWPHGFVCHRCAGTAHSRFLRNGTGYWQCSKAALSAWSRQGLHSGADVYRDGLGAFRALEAEHAHPVIRGSGRTRCEADNARWVNLVLSSLKRSLDGACHAFKFAKYAHRYLAEIMWRFNRRVDLTTLTPEPGDRCRCRRRQVLAGASIARCANVLDRKCVLIRNDLACMNKLRPMIGVLRPLRHCCIKERY